MFLEQRVGRLEERLGELENGTNEDVEQRLDALDEADLTLRNEAVQLQQRLAELEALSLKSKLDHILDLFQDVENRLDAAENHRGRQLEINTQYDGRIENLEQAVEGLEGSSELGLRVESMDAILQDLQRQAHDIRERFEAWDHLSLPDRTRQLEDSLSAFHAFRNESQQLFEVLQNDLASQVERDDQLFDLLGKLEDRISGLDVQQLQERMNEAETAMTGFRAVVKEVRQRFEQSEQRHNELSHRCEELEERSLSLEENIAFVGPLKEQVRTLEEQLLELDLQPFGERLAVMENRMGDLEFDPSPLIDRLQHVEQSARILTQQFQAFPEFAESTQQQLVQLTERQSDAAGRLHNHDDRLNGCEAYQRELPNRLKQLEDRLAAAAELPKQLQEMNDRIKELEIDNRDLRDRLRTLKVSGGDSRTSSSDWLGRSLATVGLAVALVVGWLLFQPQPVVTAQRFVLQGPDGKMYALLDSKDARAHFELKDDAGRPLVLMGASSDGTAIRLADSTGANRMVLGLDPSGNPGVTLADSRGTGRIEMGVAETSYFALRDVHGDRRAVLAATQQGPQVALLRPSEQPQVLLGNGAVGDGISVYDQQKKLRVGMGITADGAAVNLFDESEHRRAVVSANQAGPALAFLGDNDQHRTTLGMSANGESVLNLHDANGIQRIVLHVSESDAKLNVLDSEKNVVFATP